MAVLIVIALSFIPRREDNHDTWLVEVKVLEKVIAEMDGEQEKEENAVYLLKMDYLNWQNPNKVRDYIMSNLNYKGNISIFYIYEK